MPTRVGLREVAQRAGVSIATVSNTLNRPERVSDTTRERVLAIMEQMGFVRNELARQLRTGGAMTIGMVVLNIANPFFASLAHAVEDAAEALGCTTVLGSSGQKASWERRYLDLFEEQQSKGVLIAPLGGITARMRELHSRGMPMVVFSSEDQPDFCTVTLDGRRGGYLATRHLIEAGHRRIAFLGGPLGQVDDRWTGALQACAEVSGARLVHIDTADQTMSEGHRAAAILGDMSPQGRPDAVFAANDLLALGLLQGLVADGRIRVPSDLAVVGYDDIDYAASGLIPLSTVRQPVDELAHSAVRLLVEEADAPEAHRHQALRIAPQLVVRRSSAGGA